MTRINDLPNEILGKIMERLPPTDLRRVTRVSRRWFAVVDELVGIHKYVGRDTHMWPGEEFEPITTLSEVGIQNLAVSYLCENADQIPEFRHPYLVRELWIDDFIQPATFQKLLDPLFNLSTLILHVSVFGDFSFSKTSATPLTIPSLSNFTISLYGIGQSSFHMDFFDSYTLVNIVEVLLLSKFSALRTLSLHLPLFLPYQQTVDSAVIRMISEHRARLEKLLVNFEFTARIGRQSLEGYPVFAAEEALDMVSGLRLKKMFIHCCRRGREAMDVYQKILEAQSGHLEKLHITSDYIQLPNQVLESNWATLTAVQLAVTTTEERPLNLFPLAVCTQLKILTLVGPQKTADLPLTADGQRSLHDLHSRNPDLIGGQNLPPSMQSVRIFNLYLESDDADFIIANLPVLKLVSLHCIGTTKSLGLKLSTIASIMERKQILFFTTINGLNCASLTSSPENEIESPFACLAGLLLKSMESSGFCLQMDMERASPTYGRYKFGTEVTPSLPVSTDPKIIIDTEVNIDFAIENDELFESEDNDDAQGPPAFAVGAGANGPQNFDFGEDDELDNLEDGDADEFQDWEDAEMSAEDEDEEFDDPPELELEPAADLFEDDAGDFD